MSKLLLPLLSAALLLAVGGCAGNQTMKERVRVFFEAADVDHDEQLTPAEFETLKLPGGKFEDVDTDHNGRVSLAELRSYVLWRRIEAEGWRPVSGPMSDPRRNGGYY